MESRRIQKVGERSYSISLPKDWVVLNKLKEKDTVFVETTSNNELLIKKNDLSEIKEKTFSFNIDEIDNVEEFIIFCYIKNIDSMKLFSRKKDIDKISELRLAMRDLEGFDITNEDENTIEVSFLFKDVNITITKMIKRMNYLIKIMYQSVLGDERSSVEEIEKTIDRLYKLAKRILFASLNNSKLRKENGIKHQEDFLFYLTIIRRLENFADCVYQLSGQKLSSNEKKTVKDFVELLSIIIESGSKAKIDTSGFEKLKNSSSNLGFIFRRMYHICIDILENKMSIEFNNKYFS